MASGVLVYSNGLKGTQPIHISNGGSSATFVGEPQVPQILIDRTLQYNSVTFPFYKGAKKYFIKKISSAAYEAGVTSTCTFLGQSVKDVYWQNSSSKTTWSGRYYLVDQSDYSAISNSGSGTIGLHDVISSYQLYDKNNAELVIKEGAYEENLSNPAGFVSFGTEYDSTKYNNIKSTSDGAFNSHNANPRTAGQTFRHIGFKFSSVGNFQNLAIGTKVGIYVTERTNYSSSGSISFQLYNNRTSEWDTLALGVSYGSDNGGADDLTGHPAYDIVASSDYLLSGDVYGRMVITGGDNTTNAVEGKLAYLNLVGYNAISNTIKL